MGVTKTKGDIEKEACYNNNHSKIGFLAVQKILEEGSFHWPQNGEDPS